MKGRVLWDYIEERARIKLGKDSSWELRAAEILDKEIARATLRQEFSKGEATCLVVYAKGSEG